MLPAMPRNVQQNVQQTVQPSARGAPDPGAGIPWIVMAKAPVAGRVKTRLVDPAGVDAMAAADLARRMLRCTIERLLVRGGAVVLAHAPDDAGPSIHDAVLTDGLDGADRVRLVPQGGGDLGERIARAWTTAAGDGPAAVLGMDSPDAPAAALDDVPAWLDRFEAAVGPTEDGGYWILAARRRPDPLLADVEWGTDRVFARTRARAVAAGWTLGEMPRWYDVDSPADLPPFAARLEAARDERAPAAFDACRAWLARHGIAPAAAPGGRSAP